LVDFYATAWDALGQAPQPVSPDLFLCRGSAGILPDHLRHV